MPDSPHCIKRAQITGKSTFVGLAILVCAGMSYGVFSPAFNLASNDQVLPPPVRWLSPAVAVAPRMPFGAEHRNGEMRMLETLILRCWVLLRPKPLSMPAICRSVSADR